MIDPRLVELRERWAARSPGCEAAQWLGEVEKPWLKEGPLREQLDRLPLLYAEGEARLALVLQANDLAWKGETTAPGTLLISWDPWFEIHPGAQSDTASRFHAVARQGAVAPGLRALVEDSRDHMKDRRREALPLVLTSGRAVFAFDCVFFPNLLPGGRLCDVLLPVVVLRQGPAICAVPPARFWPATLRARWEREAEGSP